MNLSKSKYCKGIQCPKMLWMDKHKRELFDESVMNQNILDSGNAVGNVAMGYYGDFAEVSFDYTNMQKMIEQTKELLQVDIPVICEATFEHSGDLCMVDILRKDKDGYHLVEVKSSTEFKDIYLDDMAYQYHVVSSNGLPIKSISLMHINSKYVRCGDLDLEQLFTVKDYTEEVLAKQVGIAQRISRIKTVASQDEEPRVDIGLYCEKPYKCGYQNYCWRHLPENSVFDIAGLWMSKKVDAYRQDIVSFEDALAANVKLSDKQLQQVLVEVGGLAPQIDKDAIRSFLSQLQYPIYHFDFETFQQPIPLWDEVRPWRQIPFQYSLHIQEYPGAEPIHKEYLAPAKGDTRRLLAKQLCIDIPKGSCVLAYHMSFERARLEELAELFPDLSGHLRDICDHVIDLEIPFKSRSYYTREMKGRSSIKAVLPALCSDSPELDYTALGLIQVGTEASSAFATLATKSVEEQEVIRQALLAYCRLDTLAMVKVLEKLYEVAEG